MTPEELAEGRHGLDVERLRSAVSQALDRWFGPPSDGISAATRRAIADEAIAIYVEQARAALGESK